MDPNVVQRVKVHRAIEKYVLSCLESLGESREPGEERRTTPLASRFTFSRIQRIARQLGVYRIVHAGIQNGTNTMKRDVYYSNPALFKSQRTTDLIGQRLASELAVHPRALSIAPSARGLILGPVSWQIEGVTSSAAEEIRSVPYEPCTVSTSHRAVLVLEKESIFHILATLNVLSAANIVIVTAKGYPDVATRDFLALLSERGSIPIFVLTDADPHGLDIYLCYRRGSSSNQFRHLVNCYWMGISIDDIPLEDGLELTEADKKVMTRIWIEANKEGYEDIKNELRKMELLRRKGEMEAVIGRIWKGETLLENLFKMMRNSGLSWLSTHI